MRARRPSPTSTRIWPPGPGWASRGRSRTGPAATTCWCCASPTRPSPGRSPPCSLPGAVHAREYTTAEMVTRFAEHLVETYGTDADTTWLLDHHEVHLMPIVNPDGRKHAEGGDYWRKNDNTSHCPDDRPGVDLNRNFDFQWGGAGSSGDECSTIYRGTAAGSEPETQAVMAVPPGPVSRRAGNGRRRRRSARHQRSLPRYPQLQRADPLSLGVRLGGVAQRAPASYARAQAGLLQRVLAGQRRHRTLPGRRPDPGLRVRSARARLLHLRAGHHFLPGV